MNLEFCRKVAGLSCVYFCVAIQSFAAVDSDILKIPTEPSLPQEGIPYFLPKPVLIMKTVPQVDAVGKIKGVRVDVEKQIVADRSQGFLLSIKDNVFTESKTSFEIQEGLLSSVNYTGENKAGEAIQSVASFIFSLQMVPALKAQYGALKPMVGGGASVRLVIDDLTDTPADFRTFIDDNYGDKVSSLIKTDEEAKKLLAAAKKELAEGGAAITFDQLMAGVSAESLTRQFIYTDALNGAGGTFKLGEQLVVGLKLGFDRPASFSSSKTVSVNGDAGVPLPGKKTVAPDPLPKIPLPPPSMPEPTPPADNPSSGVASVGPETKDPIQPYGDTSKDYFIPAPPASGTSLLAPDVKPLSVEQIAAAWEAELKKSSSGALEATWPPPGGTVITPVIPDIVTPHEGDSKKEDSGGVRITRNGQKAIGKGGGIYIAPKHDYSDSILVRTERAVAIRLSISPSKSKLQNLLRQSLKSAAAPALKLAKARRLQDEDMWKNYFDSVRSAADAKTLEAQKAQDAYLIELEQWLSNDAALTDGRAQFKVALLPVVVQLKGAKTDKLIAEAAKLAAELQLLDSDYPTYKGEFLATLAKIYLLRNEKSAESFTDNIGSYFELSTVASFPSPESYLIPIERLAMGKSDSGLKLEKGMLRSISVTRAAPAAELLALPSKVIEPYISLLKELITIRVTSAQQSDDVIAQKVAVAKLEKELASLSQPVDPAAKEHASAIAALTREKELLELGKTVTALQRATTVDPAQVAHDALTAALERQKQILELQSAIDKLTP